MQAPALSCCCEQAQSAAHLVAIRLQRCEAASQRDRHQHIQGRALLLLHAGGHHQLAARQQRGPGGRHRPGPRHVAAQQGRRGGRHRHGIGVAAAISAQHVRKRLGKQGGVEGGRQQQAAAAAGSWLGLRYAAGGYCGPKAASPSPSTSPRRSPRCPAQSRGGRAGAARGRCAAPAGTGSTHKGRRGGAQQARAWDVGCLHRQGCSGTGLPRHPTAPRPPPRTASTSCSLAAPSRLL